MKNKLTVEDIRDITMRSIDKKVMVEVTGAYILLDVIIATTDAESIPKMMEGYKNLLDNKIIIQHVTDNPTSNSASLLRVIESVYNKYKDYGNAAFN